MLGHSLVQAVAPAYAYGTSDRSRRLTDIRSLMSPTLVLNLVLCGLLLAALGFYIIETNNITAHQYRGQVLSERLLAAQESNGTLMNITAGLQGKDTIAAFAQSRSMVQVRDAVYIFDNGSVAVQR